MAFFRLMATSLIDRIDMCLGQAFADRRFVEYWPGLSSSHFRDTCLVSKLQFNIRSPLCVALLQEAPVSSHIDTNIERSKSKK